MDPHARLIVENGTVKERVVHGTIDVNACDSIGDCDVFDRVVRAGTQLDADAGCAGSRPGEVQANEVRVVHIRQLQGVSCNRAHVDVQFLLAWPGIRRCGDRVDAVNRHAMGAIGEVILGDFKKRVLMDCKRKSTRTGQVVVQIPVCLPRVAIRPDAVTAGAGKVVLLNRVATGIPLKPNANGAVGGGDVFNDVARAGLRRAGLHNDAVAGSSGSRPGEVQSTEVRVVHIRQLQGVAWHRAHVDVQLQLAWFGIRRCGDRVDAVNRHAMGAIGEVILGDFKKRVLMDCKRKSTRTGQVVVQIPVCLPRVAIRPDAVTAGVGKVVLLNRVAAGSSLEPNADPAVGGDHCLNRVVGTGTQLDTDSGCACSRPRQIQTAEVRVGHRS